MSASPSNADTMVVVEDVWKKYQLGEFGSNTLADDVRRSWARLLRRGDPIGGVVNQGPAEARRGDVWVLQGVDMSINRGDVVGLIGPNGAGKSTLLKVLSRITTPTRGRILTKGRVASLLEVGTGFHPELTGRENIYLNGTIMGMTRRDVSARLDEIIEFSDCGMFIDTPVRRYSSGMYVRLGFAVAAHLNTEILAVDEVLAVGDVRFQAKCIDKMSSLAAEGTTIIFVSHNSSLVQRLCTRAAVIADGKAVMFDGVDDALAFYHRGSRRSSTTVDYEIDERPTPQITRVVIDPTQLEYGRVVVDISFSSSYPFQAVPGVIVYAGGMQPVFTSNTRMHPDRSAIDGLPPDAVQEATYRLEVDDLPLFSGAYTLSAWLGDESSNFDVKEHAVQFSLETKHTLPEDLAIRYVGPLAVSSAWSLQ